MTTRSQEPPIPYQQAPSPLAECLIALAGTPDDSSWVTCQLTTIAQLSADLVVPVSYASVTTYGDEGFVTVAASSEVAVAVDEAQYTDRTGPCLEAVDTGSPVAVPDVRATMTWPGFREAATRFGLRASLSIPLFAGRGTTIAALNLYGRDPATMAPVIAAVWGAYGPHDPTGIRLRDDPDPGAAGLVVGFGGAFAVRALIQQAIGLIMESTRRSADSAYLMLRLRAAETGTTLTETATALIAEQEW